MSMNEINLFTFYRHSSFMKDVCEGGKKSLFKSAGDDVNNLVCNLGHIVEKLQKQEYVTNDDWINCFRMFNESKQCGALSKVTKGK